MYFFSKCFVHMYFAMINTKKGSIHVDDEISAEK